MRIENIFPPEIINNPTDEKITLQMRTHKTAPDNRADRIEFKNLKNSILQLIKQPLLKEKLTKELNELYYDEQFWIHNLDGLVILGDLNDLVVYRINRKLENSVSVGHNFNLTSLLRHFQSDDEYFVLGLTKDNFNIYRANRYSIEQCEFDEDDDIRKDDVLGTEREGRTLNSGNYGGLTNKSFHGHNVKSEEEKIDQERYFRYIDRFVKSNLDNPNNYPIILMGLPEHLGEFKKISSNPLIIDESIQKSVESLLMHEDEVLASIWKVIEPSYLAKTTRLIDQFQKLSIDGMASADVAEIINALLSNQVETLVIEDNKRLKNNYRSLSNYSSDVDVINILVELATKSKSKIVVLPKSKMPTDSGVFALYRFKVEV